MTMPITKHGYIVKDINVLADTIRKAFQIAQSGRPGTVLVDITKDVTANTCEYTYQPAVKPVYENKYTEEAAGRSCETDGAGRKAVYVYWRRCDPVRSQRAGQRAC